MQNAIANISTFSLGQTKGFTRIREYANTRKILADKSFFVKYLTPFLSFSKKFFPAKRAEHPAFLYLARPGGGISRSKSYFGGFVL
jgi:hypothetical protein